MTDSLKSTPALTLINIGFGNTISSGQLIEIDSPEAALTKRLISEARDLGMLIDASYGRQTRSVMRMDAGHIVLSPLQPGTLAKRVITEGKKHD